MVSSFILFSFIHWDLGMIIGHRHMKAVCVRFLGMKTSKVTSSHSPGLPLSLYQLGSNIYKIYRALTQILTSIGFGSLKCTL